MLTPKKEIVRHKYNRFKSGTLVSVHKTYPYASIGGAREIKLGDDLNSFRNKGGPAPWLNPDDIVMYLFTVTLTRSSEDHDGTQPFNADVALFEDRLIIIAAGVLKRIERR